MHSLQVRYNVNDSVSVSSIFLILIALMTQLVSLVPLQIRNNLVEKHSEIIIEHELISEAQEAGESKKDDEVEAVEVNETSENVSLQKSKPSLYIIPIGIAECAMAFFISLYISRI